MTVTANLQTGINAAKTGRDDALVGLKKIANKAESRHDLVVSQIRTLPTGSDQAKELEEVRAGLAATINFCNSSIEAHTGEPPPESKQHDARDESGKFAKVGSIGHIFRRIIGKG